MERFQDYLESINVVDLYPQFNHVLKFLYTMLIAASRDHADTITATHAMVSWAKGDKVLDRFPSSDTAAIPSFGYGEALLQSLQ